MTTQLTTPAPKTRPLPADAIPLATITDAPLLPPKVSPPPRGLSFRTQPPPPDLRDPATLADPGA